MLAWGVSWAAKIANMPYNESFHADSAIGT